MSAKFGRFAEDATPLGLISIPWRSSQVEATLGFETQPLRGIRKIQSPNLDSNPQSEIRNPKSEILFPSVPLLFHYPQHIPTKNLIHIAFRVTSL